MTFKGFCILLVTTFSLQLADSGVTKKGEETTFIPLTYPGPTKEVVGTRYGAVDNDVPKECQGKNYCDIKPSNYPDEKFKKMFKGTKRSPQASLVEVASADRFGDDDDNCQTTVSFKPLYQVRSKRGTWHTVVQAPEENYVQAVRLETCVETGRACFEGLGSLPDIVTSCVQKYSVWEFLVDNGNGTDRVETELPVCCSCHYKTVPLNLSDRK